MGTLERELRRRNIEFNAVERRVRYVFIIFLTSFCGSFLDYIRCFPHIVNLACKAVLAAMTKLEHGLSSAPDYVPKGPLPLSFLEALTRDPIATLQSLIRSVCSFSAMLFCL